MPMKLKLRKKTFTNTFIESPEMNEPTCLCIAMIMFTLPNKKLINNFPALDTDIIVSRDKSQWLTTALVNSS